MGLEQIKVELQDTMGSDKAIANAAWTSSYDKARREAKYDEPENIERIVKGCVNDCHTSPLESVIFRFWMRHPVFTDRQHMTHRIASHNGLSGRYRTVPDDHYELPEDVCEVIDAAYAHLLDDPDYEGSQEAFNAACRHGYSFYEDQLAALKKAEKDGVIANAQYKRARELLRGAIGTAFMVERISTVNLHSFANYQRLRNDPSHAQPEIVQVARLMLREVVKSGVCPIALTALMQRGFTTQNHNDLWTIAGDDE